MLPSGVDDAVAGARLQLLEVPGVEGDADHRLGQRALGDHLVKRRKYLLVGEVAGGAEEHQRVGPFLAHARASPVAVTMPAFGFSTWPPKA